MPHSLVVPQMGESITEGIIAKLLVKNGAVVTADTPVFELETDKITSEVPAGAAGAVTFTVKEGDTVPVGSVVATIDTSVSPEVAAKGPEVPPAKNQTLSPAVKKLVADNNLTPATIPGSGKDGRITKGDVLKSLDAKPSTPASAPAASVSRTKMSPLRARIAQRLVQAQHTAAILTTFNEVDMSAIMALRKTWKEEFEKKYGVGLGFMSLFTLATVKALQKYPLLNSQIDGNEVVTFDGVHMGIAVGTEKGLVVPVLRYADRLSLADIEKAIKAAAVKARDGKLAIDDLQGGTFTITNGGVYGSLMSTPIINPPQSGILGMHTIKERPIAVNGQVVIRPMMYLALSYDHRIVDGAEAVGFLIRIKELLEAPERLVLGL